MQSKQLGEELAIKIWNKHIEVFNSFDLTCITGSLEDETKSNALFNAIVTLSEMLEIPNIDTKIYIQAISYLQGSKYYSEENKNSTY